MTTAKPKPTNVQIVIACSKEFQERVDTFLDSLDPKPSRSEAGFQLFTLLIENKVTLPKPLPLEISSKLQTLFTPEQLQKLIENPNLLTPKAK